MRPELLRIPLPDWSWLPIDSLPIRGYGAMLALGFLAAIVVATRRARREGENPDHIYNAAIIALLGGILGARLFDVIEYADQPPHFRYHNWLLGFNLLDGLAVLWLAVGAVAGAAMAFVGVLPWSRKDDRPRWAAVAAWAVVAGLVLGRAAYIHGVSAALPPGAANPYAGFIDALKITSGGLTVYGGLMLAVAVFVPYLAYLRYRHGVNPLKLLDIIAPSLALGLAFGRMGCLLNGCCWGAECHLPWAITWPEGTLPYTEGHIRWPVHPAQVYGIINGLLLFLALHLGYRRKKRHGVVLGAFFGLYAVSRFLLECVRSDEPKKFLWGLSISQAVGVFMVAAVVAYFLWLRKSRMSDLLWQPPASAANANRPSRAERRRAERHRKP